VTLTSSPNVFRQMPYGGVFTVEVGIGWISFSFETREGLDMPLLGSQTHIGPKSAISNVRTDTESGGKG